MTLESIDIRLLDAKATIPTRSHKTDAGLDLYALEDVLVPFDKTEIVRTGIAVDIPEGYEGSVRPRSGFTSKRTLRVQYGTIDTGYTGEVGILVDNFVPHPMYAKEGGVNGLKISAGDKIAQLVVSPVETPTVNIVGALVGESDRGENGFGSSGDR